jgi:hypothetical protein
LHAAYILMKISPSPRLAACLQNSPVVSRFWGERPAGDLVSDQLLARRDAGGYYHRNAAGASFPSRQSALICNAADRGVFERRPLAEWAAVQSPQPGGPIIHQSHFSGSICCCNSTASLPLPPNSESSTSSGTAGTSRRIAVVPPDIPKHVIVESGPAKDQPTISYTPTASSCISPQHCTVSPKQDPVLGKGFAPESDGQYEDAEGAN